jgi:hypothetical protein
MPGEPAAEASAFRRELLFSLPSADNFERDGPALVIRGINLLAAGTWTDAAQRTPCKYGGDVVTRDAGNWADSTLWARHNGGVPRSVAEGIGRIENQRPGTDAAIGDLRLHGLTQTSRDIIALVEAGEVDAFSPELVGPERYNADEKVYEKTAITFLGGAIVAKGACSTCTLRRNNAAGEEPGQTPEACATDDQPAEPPTGAPADSDMELAELEAKMTELEAANVDLTRQLGEAQAANTALKTEVESLTTTARSLEGLEARVKKIEDTPLPKAGAPAEPARELSVPAGLVITKTEIYSEV